MLFDARNERPDQRGLRLVASIGFVASTGFPERTPRSEGITTGDSIESCLQTSSPGTNAPIRGDYDSSPVVSTVSRFEHPERTPRSEGITTFSASTCARSSSRPERTPRSEGITTSWVREYRSMSPLPGTNAPIRGDYDRDSRTRSPTWRIPGTNAPIRGDYDKLATVRLTSPVFDPERTPRSEGITTSSPYHNT